MNCLTESELQAYLDGELLDSDRICAEHHIKECPHCVEVFNRLKNNKIQIFKLLNELQQREIPIEIPAFVSRPTRRSFSRNIKILSVAASLLLVIGLGFYFRNKTIRRAQTLNIAKATIDLTRNIDPNRMNHNKQMVVVITNASGDVVDSYIAE